MNIITYMCRYILFMYIATLCILLLTAAVTTVRQAACAGYIVYTTMAMNEGNGSKSGIFD